MNFVLDPSALTDEKQNILVASAEGIYGDAIAGSGKTTLLGHLALKHCRAGVPPDEIAMLTVSRPAADHLSAFLEALEKRHRIKLPRAMTIHGLCGKLRNRIDRFKEGGEVLPESDERLSQVLARAMEAGRLLLEDDDEAGMLPANPGNLKGLYDAIARIKGEYRFDLKAILEEDNVDIPWLSSLARQPELTVASLVAFERIRIQENFLTFPDLPLEILHRQRTDPAVARLLASYKVMGFDEGNDLNTALLSAALSSRQTGCRVIVVGDKNQCVQTKQGARANVMAEDFPRLVGNVVTMPINESHRFGSNLTKRMKPLMQCYGQPAQEFASATRHKTTIQGKAIKDPQAIIDIIASGRAKEPDWRTGVLFRQRSEALPLEFALIAAEMPYTMLGHKAVAYDDTLEAIVTLLAADCGLLDSLDGEVRAHKMIEAGKFFFPMWDKDSAWESYLALAKMDKAAGIGAEYIRLTMPKAVQNSPERPVYQRRLQELQAFWAAGHAFNAKSDAATALDTLIKQLRIKHLITEDTGSQETQRETIATLDAFLAYTREYQLTLGQMFKQMIKARLVTRTGSAAANESGTICVSTFLRAKGKEFEQVILADTSADKVPVPPSLDGAWEDANEHRAIELNLFYVAITRAKHALWLLHRAGQAPSRFIEAMKASNAAKPAAKSISDSEPDKTESAQAIKLEAMRQLRAITGAK
ncbi:DEAD/DEAH box helicase [Chitinimonas naiadis]